MCSGNLVGFLIGYDGFHCLYAFIRLSLILILSLGIKLLLCCFIAIMFRNSRVTMPIVC